MQQIRLGVLVFVLGTGVVSFACGAAEPFQPLSTPAATFEDALAVIGKQLSRPTIPGTERERAAGRRPSRSQSPARYMPHRGHSAEGRSSESNEALDEAESASPYGRVAGARVYSPSYTRRPVKAGQGRSPGRTQHQGVRRRSRIASATVLGAQPSTVPLRPPVTAPSRSSLTGPGDASNDFEEAVVIADEATIDGAGFREPPTPYAAEGGGVQGSFDPSPSVAETLGGVIAGGLPGGI